MGDHDPAWKEAARTVERLADPERSLFETAPELAGVHRASPLSVVSAATSGLGAIAAVGLLFVVQQFGNPNPGELAGAAAFALGLIALSIVGAVLSWRTRTWELTDEGIILKTGLITKKQLQVPYEHIHAINMSSSLAERLLGLMTLDLDTGAAKQEGDNTKIAGMQAGLAHALREELFARKAQAMGAEAPAERGTPEHSPTPDAQAPSVSHAAEEPRAVYELSTRELVLAALTQARIAAQAVALVILLIQGVNLLHENSVIDLQDIGEQATGWSLNAVALGALAFVAVALLAGFIVSFAVGLVSYAGFRCTRYDDRLVIERGLLDRASHTVALERIQYVGIRQGLIRRLLGFAEVRAYVIAGPGGDDASSTANGVALHPFIDVDRIEAFLERVAPAYAGIANATDLKRLPKAAARRQAMRTGLLILLVWLMVGGCLALAHHFLPQTDAFATALRPFLLVLGVLCGGVASMRLVLGGILRYRDSRIGHTAREFVCISGGVKRICTIVPRTHLQHASLAANPFQRRADVATFTTRTAATGEMAMRDLALTDAEELLCWLRPYRQDGAGFNPVGLRDQT